MTTIFRGDDHPETDGIDVGTSITLPPDSWFQKLFKRVAGVLEHSPREYCDGIKIIMKKDPAAVSDLARVRKQLVN